MNKIIKKKRNFGLINKKGRIKTSNKNLYNYISKKFLGEYYCKKYEELFDIPPSIVWGRDIKLLSNLLKTYTSSLSKFNCKNPYDLLCKCCDRFFYEKDRWALKNAWNIVSFYSAFPRLVLLLKQQVNNVWDPIIKAYKLAYFNHTKEKYKEDFDQYSDDLTDIFIWIKPMYLKYKKGFSLFRFSEIYFLKGFEYLDKINGNYDIHFFTTAFYKKYFIKWLNDEWQEIYRYVPKDIGHIDNKFYDKEVELNNMEDFLLLHLPKDIKKEVETVSCNNRYLGYERLLKKYNLYNSFKNEIT